MNKLDLYALASAINQKDNDSTGGLKLRVGKVTSVGSNVATVTIGGVSVPNVPFYQGLTVVTNDIVDVLLDGPTPRIIGVFA